MPKQIFEELIMLNQVEAVALGGSRAGENYDEKSDYDVYVYVNAPIDEDLRRKILASSCNYMEIGNHFWEYEDNCTLNNGIDIDILYRNMDDFMGDIDEVVVKCQAHNAYTTCMWHNLLTCKIIYDRHGKLTGYQRQYDIPYPPKLKKNIIERQLCLIDSSMPAYPIQIEKAVKRGDWVSINHRVSEFLASYFDLIFALNEKTNPGEKRLVELCTKQCALLPEDFEKNLRNLFLHMYSREEQVSCIQDIEKIVDNVKKILN
jgi:hypothetical protein